MTHVLIWGRHGNYGPDYPRNRVIESVLTAQGHDVSRFLPRFSPLADWEYRGRNLPRPDLIWVPCFRHRDVRAAARYARRISVPLVFDPLISAYDKQVNERRKFPPTAWRARRLLAREQREFAAADWLVADTAGHAAYFADILGVPLTRQVVIPVGAEEALFKPLPTPADDGCRPLELVFFGTFIGLQGVDVLAQAIQTWSGPPVRWRLIGQGPMKPQIEAMLAPWVTAQAGAGVVFEPWGPLAELPDRLASADAFLGIFGQGDKTKRVIPNKVYQGLALGRPVITAATPAYPSALSGDEAGGLFWVKPGEPRSLHEAIDRLLSRRHQLGQLGRQARATYDTWFSNALIASRLADLFRQAGV